jgi:hypothetical protein
MQNALFISYMTWKPDEHETADCARPAKVGILREIVMTMIHTSRILSSSRFFYPPAVTSDNRFSNLAVGDGLANHSVRRNHCVKSVAGSDRNPKLRLAAGDLLQ